jgi:hypothetical protein
MILITSLQHSAVKISLNMAKVSAGILQFWLDRQTEGNELMLKNFQTILFQHFILLAEKSYVCALVDSCILDRQEVSYMSGCKGQFTCNRYPKLFQLMQR